MKKTLRAQAGFTFFELSIAMIIIGLVAGGILVGRELIEGAAIRAQASQFERYSIAVNNFQTKYDYLPGDIPWKFAQDLNLLSSNGWWDPNGDGQFNSSSTPRDLLYTATTEHHIFWNHLSRTGFLDIKYAGATFDRDDQYNGIVATYPEAVGLYFPAMKINDKLGILPITLEALGGGNYFVTGIKSPDYALDQIQVNSFTPMQAKQLDAKMDDGIPSTGIVRAIKVYWDSSCTTAGTCATIDDNIAAPYYSPQNCVNNGGTRYVPTNPAVACRIVVKMQ